MAEKKILDCTLRDGGYINNWNFGKEVTRDIIFKLIASGVDYVEVGFLRDCEYCADNTLFNNIEELKKILPENKGNTKFSVMALHNKYDIDKLEEYDGKTVEIVRVTFHDYDIDKGLTFCEKVIKKGYKCFCNPINIMGYSDEMLLKLIRKINKLHPYGFSIVDTFGSMMKSDLLRIYSLVENNLDKDIVVGLHLHENLSLAYSLAQEFTTIVSNERDIIIDGSLLGMGRVPGNLCIELFMDYMNRCFGKEYKLDNALDAIDEYILPIKEKTAWGYSIEYALSAKYNLHRNYAEYLINKEKLCARDINNILAQISEKKKTAYDEAYIEGLYEQYLNVKVDDEKALEYIKEKIIGKDILIIAPGGTLNENRKNIIDYIKENNTFVIAANFADSRFKIDATFYSNLKRYEKYSDKENSSETWITSNITKSGCIEKCVVDFWNLAYDGKKINDNSVIMLLKLLSDIGVKKVVIAGMDGYSNNNDYVKVIYQNRKKNPYQISKNNELLKKSIAKFREVMQIQFITKSIYDV